MKKISLEKIIILVVIVVVLGVNFYYYSIESEVELTDCSDTGGDEIRELTDIEINFYNDMFSFTSSDGNVNGVATFFDEYFAKPSEVSVIDYLAYAQSDFFTDEEYDIVCNELFEDTECYFNKIEYSNINGVLLYYFGITYEEVTTSSSYYLDAYDSFYSKTTGIGIYSLTVYSGTVTNENIVLNVKNFLEEEGEIVLVKNGDEYLFYSYLPVEE